MREHKKTAGVIIGLLFAVLLIATDTQPVQAAVKLSQTAVSLCVGDSTKLAVSGTTKKVTWKSSAPKIAKVNANGKIKALKKGNATITATVNKKNYTTCQVHVNRTFKIDKSNVTIKKNTTVNAYLSVNGAVNATIKNKKICSVTFGTWNGDNMPLTIVPKKIGTTTITFTNSVNNEYCILNVTVTALPSKATFRTSEISTGADALVIGENQLNVTFQLDRKASNTAFVVYDADGTVVRKLSLGTVPAKKDIALAWNGTDDEGRVLAGTYTYAVVADGNRSVGGTVTVLAASPFGKGDGSQTNPYRVSNLAELYLVREYNGAHFVQDADIDFNSSAFSSLFDDKNPFNGTYCGKYDKKSYQLKNVLGYNSIFGTIGTGGAITDVTMNNCVINMTGSLLAMKNCGTIENCSVNGSVLCNAGCQASMLVLYNEGTIRDCSVSGKLTVNLTKAVTSATLKAGGIALYNGGTIVGCTSSVDITQQLQIDTYNAACTYEIYSGGITAENASTGFVTKSTFSGTINAQIVLPQELRGTVAAGSIYSGYAAGNNLGYIGQCVNAGSAKDLSAAGTGTGMIQ